MGRQRIVMGGVALFLAVLDVFSVAQAEPPGTYYHGKEEGWFWRELIPLPPPEKELDNQAETAVQEPSTPIQHSEQNSLRPFSPEWMREKLPEYRDRALENPSADNVRAYFHLQRYAMDMAERFAQVAQRVVLADPSLDENVRRPLSTYGAHMFDEVARENTLKVAAKVATLAGVWYFYKSDCPFCSAQNPVLERLRARIGLAILPIALDGRPMTNSAFDQFLPDRGHAQQLGVARTPTLYLVRKPNEFVLLSEGLLTDDGLLDRIVHAAHDAQWISDEEFNSTRARRPADGGLRALEINQLDLSDPVALIEALKAQERTIMVDE